MIHQLDNLAMIKKSILSTAFLAFLFIVSVAQRAGNPIPLIPAEIYLVRQFNDKDVIFLGELHCIKEQVEFVGSMIPVLHKNGINLLFSEFARFKDTRRIDSLITARTFDKKLAARIMFDDSWDWGYQEYVDIYFSAWQTNQMLKPHEKPFRIIGLEDYDGEFTGTRDPGKILSLRFCLASDTTLTSGTPSTSGRGCRFRRQSGNPCRNREPGNGVHI